MASNEKNVRGFFGLNVSARQNLAALAVCAVLAALSFVLDRLLGIRVTEQISVNLSFVPIMLAGYLFGPLWGGVVGALADIICTILVPQGAYHPGFTLCNFLIGFLAGTVIYFFPKLPYTIYGQLGFCLVVGSAVNLLNTVWISQVYSKVALTWPYAGSRLLFSLVSSAACGIVMFFVMRFGVTALKKSKLIS